LQVAINNENYRQDTIEGIQTVIETISTYAAVEGLYMDPAFDLHTQIRDKVIGLYTHILGFLGESIHYYQQPLASKF